MDSVAAFQNESANPCARNIRGSLAVHYVGAAHVRIALEPSPGPLRMQTSASRPAHSGCVIRLKMEKGAVTMGLRLGRRLGESLIFRTSDGEIRVTIVGLRTMHDGVNLEIEAPVSTRILRGELETRALPNGEHSPKNSDASGTRVS